MRKTIFNKFIFSGIFILIILNVYLMPSAPGDAYAPHHIANLFLDNFGYNSAFSTLPDAGQTMMTYYALNAILLNSIANSDPLLFYKLINLIQTIARFFAFIIIFGVVSYKHHLKIILSIVFTIAVSFPGIPHLLLVLIIYSISNYYNQVESSKILQTLFIFVFSFITLSLYWHTMSFLAFIVTIAYILFKIFSSKNNILRLQSSYPLLLLSFIITLVIWIYFRETSAFAIAVSALFYPQYIFDWDVLLAGLFSSGSFIEPLYNFHYTFIIPQIYIVFPRYLSYLVAYLIIFMTIFYPKKKGLSVRLKNFKVLIIVLFVSDILSKIFHYLVTKTFATDVWSLLLFPIIFGLVCCQVQIEKSYLRKAIIMAVLTLFIYSIVTTSAYCIYVNRTQLPSSQTSFDTYYSSFNWLSSHSYMTTLFSDATTAGYFQIIYAKDEVYKTHLIFNREIGNDYYKIIQGKYSLPKSSIFALNVELYEKHLTFSSLVYWNVYEPVSSEYVVKNHLEPIYNNGLMIFAK